MGGEDSLEEAMATHSSILAGRTPMDRSMVAQLVKNLPAMQETLV